MSLFVAAWPGPVANGRLAAALGPELATWGTLLAPAGPGGPRVLVRVEGAARWHVTLAFLGEEPDAEAIGARLASAGLRPATALIDGASRWFGGGVLVLPVGGLAGLAAGVGRALRSERSDPTRPFVGHLTVARRRGRLPAGESPAVRAVGRPLAGRPAGVAFAVRSVALVRSEPGPTGRRYRTLATIPLGADASAGDPPPVEASGA